MSKNGGINDLINPEHEYYCFIYNKEEYSESK